MLDYRTFRNTDPPRLVAVWNEAFNQRGCPRLPSNTLLERYVLGKIIFEPKGLFVAESNGVVVGWAHAAMSRNPFNTQQVGVTSLVQWVAPVQGQLVSLEAELNLGAARPILKGDYFAGLSCVSQIVQ